MFTYIDPLCPNIITTRDRIYYITGGGRWTFILLHIIMIFVLVFILFILSSSVWRANIIVVYQFALERRERILKIFWANSPLLDYQLYSVYSMQKRDISYMNNFFLIYFVKFLNNEISLFKTYIFRTKIPCYFSKPSRRSLDRPQKI